MVGPKASGRMDPRPGGLIRALIDRRLEGVDSHRAGQREPKNKVNGMLWHCRFGCIRDHARDALRRNDDQLPRRP